MDRSRSRTGFFADQSNHQLQNNQQQQEEQRNNLRLFCEASTNNVELQLRQLRLEAELEEQLQRFNRVNKRLVPLGNNLSGDNLEQLLDCMSLDYEPQTWRGANTAATPQTRPPYSPLAGAAANGRSPSRHYYYYYPESDHRPVNSPISSSYGNGIAQSSLRRGESTSLMLNNGDYNLNDRYRDPDAVRNQYNGYQSFSPLVNEVRGRVVMLAKTQQGSRFLQEKLRQGNPETIDMIFSEAKRSLPSLMMHQFGHHVVQMLIDVVDSWRLNEILVVLTSDLRGLSQICADFHGTRVMQKLVGRLWNPEQQDLVASSLSRIVFSLTKGTSSSHVIEQCLKYFFPNYKKLLLSAMAEKCLDIAQDKYGCCILQKSFEEADEETFILLAAPMIQNSVALSEHRYANYALQHVILMKKLEVNRNIAAKFKGNFVSVSMDKHASHVVEKLVKYSGLEEVAETVLAEILDSSNPLQVSEDPFGNFVVQAAIKVIKVGPLFDRFKDHIQSKARRLQSHLFGKNVLQGMNERLKAIDERIKIQNISNV